MDGGAVRGEATADRSPFLLEKCETCGEINDGVMSYRYCSPCYEAWQNQPKQFPAMRGMIHFRTKTKATPGHIKDIKSRKLAEDGRTVIREKSKPVYIGA